jgi:hypothetical protein
MYLVTKLAPALQKNFHGRTGPVTARKDSAMRGGPGTTEINNHLAMFAAATQIHDCGEMLDRSFLLRQCTVMVSLAVMAVLLFWYATTTT